MTEEVEGNTEEHWDLMEWNQMELVNSCRCSDHPSVDQQASEGSVHTFCTIRCRSRIQMMALLSQEHVKRETGELK